MRRFAMLAAVALTSTACASVEVAQQTTVPTTAATATTVPPTTTTTVRPTTTTTLEFQRVIGHVIDELGRPVVQASVVLGDTTRRTSQTGLFVFETTRAGPMTVSKPGWADEIVDWTGREDRLTVTLTPIIVRGLRVSADAAGDDLAFAGLLGLAGSSAVNTLVFDTKREGGAVLYDTSVEEAHTIGAVTVLYDPVERVSQAHDQGLYAMTRIVTFEDPFWVKAHPEEKLAGDWVDPMAVSARAYNIELAREACEIGFDEIQFDYVRYPAGRTGSVSGQLELTQEFRVSAIVSFLGEAQRALEPMGCHISAAVFGIVVSTGTDQAIGQRPEDMSPRLHALSPMVYPSHYEAGWRGHANPNDHPYDVVTGAIDDALGRVAPGTLVRPWLQGFWWTNEQILSSIMAAEDRGVGWMLWNVSSNFDLEALPTEEEVGR